MRTFLAICFFFVIGTGFSQVNDKITTIDFVEILNGNHDEALFYYQNNWKVLREMAVEKGYIHSFQLLETPHTKSEPFHIMLVTTYGDQDQYDKREDHFGELIEKLGSLKLLNQKKPVDFRKTVFSKDMVRHWN